MNFLFDHNISPHIARSIDQIVWPYFSDKAVSLRDKFKTNTSDEDWLSALANEQNWCFVTADKRLARSQVERIALRRSGLTGFIFAPGLAKRPVVEQTAKLLLQWELISKQSRLVSGAGLFEIPQRGSQLRNIPF